MTRIMNRKIECFVCKHKSEQHLLSSSNAFGAVDLDTRPPEMERSTEIYKIQQCPKCGYCAAVLSNSNNKAIKIIKTREYKLQLKNPHFPNKANEYLCSAIINKNSNNLIIAAWNSISAAWICDDKNNDIASMLCRTHALNIIYEVEANGSSITKQYENSVAIKVDLLRRTRQFILALDLINKELPKIENEIIIKVLNYQKNLIKNYDTNTHSIDEAIMFTNW